MDLDDFIITVFCIVDEALPQLTSGQGIRQRGPRPTLWDSEVLTIEVVGAYWGSNKSTRSLPRLNKPALWVNWVR